MCGVDFPEAFSKIRSGEGAPRGDETVSSMSAIAALVAERANKRSAGRVVEGRGPGGPLAAGARITRAMNGGNIGGFGHIKAPS